MAHLLATINRMAAGKPHNSFINRRRIVLCLMRRTPQRAFLVLNLENDTRQLYAQMYMELLELGEIDYADFIGKKLIHDVSNELKFAERLFI